MLVSYVFSELRQVRTKLLELISSPNHEVATVNSNLEAYLGLLHGCITSPDPESGGDSKLRHAVRFRWTNTLLGNTPT